MDADSAGLPASSPSSGVVMECRLTIEFAHGVVLRYCAEECVAYAFARAAHSHQLAQVTIDHLVDPDLPPLPCARLWLP
ncbi:hypothetical protein [Nocardia sp. R6R-6]|uniref:hypothetical protein n=1 Tax=Nocardia sp. R6R-6 TaxID=3459303 RepID=UPI00403E0390